eukprot:scaffold12845_cov87-Cyclotella_meneghiniana.AAC.1
MGGVWAPKPSQGPHKQRECLPVAIILRERLKYALTGKECQQICMERCVKIDGKVDIATGKMSDIYKFEIGAMVMITRGHNTGRVGTLEHVEKHDGSFSIVTIKDRKGNTFATWQANVFVIGSGDHPQVTLPKGRGIKKTILQERAEAEARGDL